MRLQVISIELINLCQKESLKHVKHCKNELFVSNNKVKRNVTYYKIVNDECVFDYEYNY